MPHKPTRKSLLIPSGKNKSARVRARKHKRPGVKAGGPGESLHRRSTDPREARGLLLGLPSHRRTGVIV